MSIIRAEVEEIPVEVPAGTDPEILRAFLRRTQRHAGFQVVRRDGAGLPAEARKRRSRRRGRTLWE